MHLFDTTISTNKKISGIWETNYKIQNGKKIEGDKPLTIFANNYNYEPFGLAFVHTTKFDLSHH